MSSHHSVRRLTLIPCLLLLAAGGTGAGVAYVKGKSVNTVDGNPKQVAAAPSHRRHIQVTGPANNSSGVEFQVRNREG